MLTGGYPPRLMDAETTAERRLRRFALAAVLTNVGIVITGGVVRVTGSGLGCPDWPTCEGGAIAPTGAGDHATWQAFIEFGNRLLTFVVLAAAVAVVWQLRRVHPTAHRLRRLAWLLPIGVLTQAVVGGITVLTGLTPVSVAVHFLLSMGLIAVAVAVHERVRPPATELTPPPRGVQHATTVVAVVGLAVLVLGTVVTGAGPHGGDIDAPRLGIDIRTAALAHADAVWLLVGVTVALVVVTWHTGPPRLRRAARLLLAVQLAQGSIGYLQYVLGIPAGLVSVHIAGAATMWAVTAAVWVRARPHPVPAASGAVSQAAG